jgi:hypothetical protein
MDVSIFLTRKLNVTASEEYSNEYFWGIAVTVILLKFPVLNLVGPSQEGPNPWLGHIQNHVPSQNSHAAKWQPTII